MVGLQGGTGAGSRGCRCGTTPVPDGLATVAGSYGGADTCQGGLSGMGEGPGRLRPLKTHRLRPHPFLRLC